MRFLFVILAALISVPAFAFNESVTISWNDPGTEDSFQVQRSATTCALANAGSWSTVASPTADVLTFTDTVQDNASYCYKVRPIKDGTQGPFSAGVDIDVPASLSAITVTAVLN